MNAQVAHDPPELHYLIEHQVWARLLADGSEAEVGITRLGIALAGEIYMCRPKGVGAVVEQGRAVAVVELAKALVSVRSPLSGTVVALNPLLAAQPELVHRDPYGSGWLARLRLPEDPAQRAAELAALVTDTAVPAAMAAHQALHAENDATGARPPESP